MCCPQADPNFHNFGGWSTVFKNTIVEKNAFDFVCTWASFCHLTPSVFSTAFNPNKLEHFTECASIPSHRDTQYLVGNHFEKI